MASDLEHIDLVTLKIGLAESDKQLEDILLQFLVPVLKKLNSSDTNVRTKVMGLLTHINRRLKPVETIQLPVEDLIHQVNDASLSCFVTNFSIIYLKSGFRRLNVEKKLQIFPLLFSSLEGKEKNQQNCLLRLIIDTFPHIPFDSSSSDALSEKFGFKNSKVQVKLLLEYLLEVLIMPYSASLKDAFSNDSINVPGLSRNAIRRLLGDAKEGHWTLDQIELIKISILKFFKKELVDINLVVTHLVVASSDTRFSVASSADSQLRNSTAVINWNDKDIVSSLYNIYLGFAANLRNKTLASDDKKQPASLRVKLKLMQSFLRSTFCTEQIPFTIQVVYDGLFGVTNDKLKILTLQFMHHIFDSAAENKLIKQAPMLLHASTKVVDETEDNNRLQTLAYIAFTKLARRLPKLFSNKFDLLQKFVKTLEKDLTLDVKRAIVDAITSMILAYKDLSADTTSLLRPFIQKAVKSKDFHIRQVGIRFSASAFPSDDIEGRYHLLLSTADAKEDITQEAKGFIETGLKSSKIPSFQSMLKFVVLKAEERLTSRDAFCVGVHKLAFAPRAYKSIINFIYNSLLLESGAEINLIDEETDDRIVFHHSSLINHIKHLQEVDFEGSAATFNVFLKFIIQYTHLITDIDVLRLLLRMVEMTSQFFSINQLLKCDPTHSKSMSKDEVVDWMRSLSFHSREEIRTLGAELFAFCFAHDQPTPEKFIKLLQDQENNLKDKIYEKQHGGLLLLAYLLGDYILWDSNVNDKEFTQYRDLITDLLTQIGEVAASSTDHLMVATACFAVGEISRRCPLPLPPGSNLPTDDDQKEPSTKLHFVNLLSNHLQNKTVHKVRQRATVALGRLPVGEKCFPHTQLIIENLLDTCEVNTWENIEGKQQIYNLLPSHPQTKHIDEQFVIAEALVSCALGPASHEAMHTWKNGLVENVGVYTNDGRKVEELLVKILDEYVEHRLPSARQASCVWLTTILTSSRCKKFSFLSDHLVRIQDAFTLLINESDELIQDLASKGFSLVYELGDDAQRRNLISGLYESLMGESNLSKVRIVGDKSRQVLKKKKSVKTIEGPALATYKELCTLASDLNKPELVYKFLYLSNIQTSKRRTKKTNIRFNDEQTNENSYKNVVETTREELSHLHDVLIPRLYRYTFDPNPGIRDTMVSLWNIVAPKPSKAILTRLPSIVDNLLEGLTHISWRFRQASCNAFTDLFRIASDVDTRSNDEESSANPVIVHLALIWKSVLRLQDDMKESVRDAATKTCKYLQKLTAKLLESQKSNKIDKNILNQVLEVLLNDGMLSKVAESRSISLSTLVEISKSSGPLIKPCITQLVVALLESLSDVESPEINYLRNRSGQDQQDKLDILRTEFIKSTPMMETAVRCLKHYDNEVLADLVPAIIDLTKRGVGVPTKAGCSYFVCQLVRLCGQDLSHFSGKLLKAFVSGLRDRSLAIRKMNAIAIGNISRVAKDAYVSKIIEKFKDWYIKAEDETTKHASASAIYAIARHSSDTLQNHLVEVMPLAFYAKHEKKELQASNVNITTATKEDDVSFEMSSKEMYEAVWNEFTPGNETALRIYLDEILSLTSMALSSSNWLVKSQAASSISSLIKPQLSFQLNQIHLLTEALLNGLNGRFWAGKENLLSALSDLVNSCSSQIEEEASRKILEVLRRESKKGNNLNYRCHAIVCLASSSTALKIDHFESIWTLSKRYFKSDSTESSEDEDEEIENETKDELIRKLILASDESWLASSLATKTKLGKDVLTTITNIHTNGTPTTRIICLQFISSFLRSILDEMTKSSLSEDQVITDFGHLHLLLLDVLKQSLEEIKYSSVRKESSKSVSTLCKLSKVTPESKKTFQQFLDVLQHQVTVEFTATSENMEALDYMKIALTDIKNNFSF